MLAAESRRLLWKGSAKQLQRAKALPRRDEDSLDIQRSYNIVCPIYGSDPGRFRPIVGRAAMPVQRARKCEHEWPRKNPAWERLLADTCVLELGPAPPGLSAASSSSTAKRKASSAASSRPTCARAAASSRSSRSSTRSCCCRPARSR